MKTEEKSLGRDLKTETPSPPLLPVDKINMLQQEERRYWLSDQYHRHSKDTMLALMNERKVDGYKRKKLKRTADTNNSISEQTPSEMDLVECNDSKLIYTGPLKKYCSR